MTQTLTYPVEYLTAACALAIYAREQSSVSHILTEKKIHETLCDAIGMQFSYEYTMLAIVKLQSISVLDVVDDAYADTIILTSDENIRTFFEAHKGTKDIYDRAWELGLDWLSSAFKSQQFWDALSNDAPSDVLPTIAPSSEGFVTFDHNQKDGKSVIDAVEAASEAVRANNEVDDTEKNWIQSHLAAGLVLVRRGGRILKDALVSTVIKPLQSALKYVIEQKAKELIAAAIKFLMSMF